jgi:hypothetical protein
MNVIITVSAKARAVDNDAVALRLATALPYSQIIDSTIQSCVSYKIHLAEIRYRFTELQDATFTKIQERLNSATQRKKISSCSGRVILLIGSTVKSR